jgi:MFS family permease
VDAKSKSRHIGIALVAGAVVGGLTGGLLSAYWWDFEPDELLDYSDPNGPSSVKGWVVAFYSALGAVVGLVIVGFLMTAISAYVELTNRTRKLGGGTDSWRECCSYVKAGLVFSVLKGMFPDSCPWSSVSASTRWRRPL